MDIVFSEACSGTEIDSISSLAERIWNDAYSEMISKEQIGYMLRRFQSSDEIRNRIIAGERYYLVNCGGRDAGYFCIVNEDDRMFLSKLYVDSEFQRRGVATRILGFVRDICKADRTRCLYLTVNRMNADAVSFYERSGFRIKRESLKEIGGGFVMDDYIMELDIEG